MTWFFRLLLKILYLVLNLGIIAGCVVRGNYLWWNQMVKSICWQNIKIINWFDRYKTEGMKMTDKLVLPAKEKDKRFTPSKKQKTRQKFFDWKIFNRRLSCSLQHIILETRLEWEKLCFRYVYRRKWNWH